MRQTLVLTAVAVLMLSAGCAAGVKGAATADQPTEAFDPCSIPDDVIAGAGLDPQSKYSMSERGYDIVDWAVCRWDNTPQPAWYSLSVLYSHNHTITDVQEDPRYSEVETVTVDGKTAVQYKFAIVDRANICDVAMSTEQGVVKLSALKKGSMELRGDLCAIVRDKASKLSVSLPL